MKKTISEEAFERFLTENRIRFVKIEEEAREPRPDYLVAVGSMKIVFEIKELSEDEHFKTGLLEVSSRIAGEHVRKKINDARKQARFGSRQGYPAALLIYNNLDPLHLFGTEEQDFLTGMFGELTVSIDRSTGKIGDSYFGYNRSMRSDLNTEFSAVGGLVPRSGKLHATLYDNPFAQVRLSGGDLPPCFEFKTIRIV